MATRSAIGLVEYDGTVTGIYCHWDGYLEQVGRKLFENYTDLEKVVELLELGDLSSLGKEIGHKHPFSPSYASEMTYEEYYRDYGHMCVSYSRDRDDDCPALVFEDINEFKQYYPECDFLYMFDGISWTYADRFTDGFVALKF